ncbi:tyrosine-protein kinase Fps85D-like, partial [Planoprotostelium fungivorum]
KSNQLEGTLPTFNSSSLVTLELRCDISEKSEEECLTVPHSQNHFSGEIPEKYLQSPVLQTISLASNILHGKIPPLLPNGQVATLDLSDNLLNGTIEEPFFAGINIATSINLGFNFLSGDIPYTLLSCSPTIRLNNNMFSRLDYINSTTITSLNVANNPLNSLFPQISAASLSILNMRNCGLRSPLPATVTSAISYLDLSYNPLDMDVSGISGIVASSSFYLRTILLKRCGITGTFSYFGSSLFVTLFKLDLSENELTGAFVIVNQVVNSIQYIDVSSNNLTGTMDESLAPASQLFLVNVSSNPRMRSYNGHSLPSWIQPDPYITVSQLAQHMSCPLLVRKDSPSSQIIVDPGYYNYSLCSCQEGYVVGDNGMCTNCPPSGICPDSEGGVDVINGTGYTCPENQFLQVRDGQVKCVPGNPNSLSRGAIAGIVCGIVFLLLVFVVAATILLLRRRNKRKMQNADMAEMQRLNLSDLMLDNVTVQHIIGEGNFGAVYKGSWSDTDVALKGLHSTLDKSEDMRWREEIALLKGLNHPNVVRLLGVTMHDDRVLMVLEFVECGSLDNYLRKSHRELTDNNLISMCFDIVKGMIYLQSKGVIHRDLAARNMLIDSTKHVKISDFGMSRQRSYYEASSKIIPFRWSPPETIRSHVSSYETDVWSFGVLAWEIFTLGRVPYHDFQTNAEVMKAVVDDKIKLEQPFRCWEYEAADRPKFRDIYCEMKELYNLTSTDDTEGLAPLATDARAEHKDPYFRESISMGPPVFVVGSSWMFRPFFSVDGELNAVFLRAYNLLVKIGSVAPVDFRPHTSPEAVITLPSRTNTPSNRMNDGSYSHLYPSITPHTSIRVVCVNVGRLGLILIVLPQARYYLLCLSRLDKWLTVLFCISAVTSLYVHEGSSTRYINSFPTSDFGSLPWPQSLDNLTLYFAPNGGCFIPQTFTTPTAVLAVRGNCTFVWKFKTAQSAGAQAFILMNRMPWAGEDQKVPIGSGGPDPSNITIPSVSLNYWEGQPLRDALLAGKQLTVTFNATRMADNQRLALLDIWKKIDPFDNWSKTSPWTLFEANSSL